MNWSARPFVRIFIFLVSGIFFAYWIPEIGANRPVYALLLITILSVVGFSIHKFGVAWNQRWIIGMILGLSIILTGIFLVNLKRNINVGIPVGNFKNYIGKVIEEPVEKAETVRTIIEVHQIIDGDTIFFEPVRAMAYFKKDSASNHLEYGDMIVFNGKLTKPPGPKNPGEFNYAEFLVINNIHYLVFISEDDWSFLGNSTNTLRSIAIKARRNLLDVLQENGIRGDDYAVAAAILLGYDQLLNPELEINFVTAGAMHILCVSGLHVGIIYLVLNFLLGFLNRNTFQKIIKVILLLGIIWFYALLTGLSPSVQRASLMISLFILATLSSKQKDVYNILAASAVILLFMNPFIIFNVGFQLSYMAVLGILIFYQPISGIFYVKNPVVKKVWEIIAVSTAAQLGTFPLAAHYFHFFPTYFWLTNIFIFPLSFAIVGAGMLLMAISWFSVISKLAGIVLAGFVFLLNYIVAMVEYLPFNGIDDLYFPWTKVVLVYGLILMLIPLLLKKRIKLLLPALVVIFMILLFNTEHKFRVMDQKRVAVYKVNSHSAIDFIDSDQHLLLIDSLLLADNSKLDYHLKNSRIAWGLKKSHFSIEDTYFNNAMDLYYDGTYGLFGGKKFMRIHKYVPYPGIKPFDVDFVVISGRRNIDIKALSGAITFDMLILDASVPFWKQEKIMDQVRELQLNCFNVNEKGAFILDM